MRPLHELRALLHAYQDFTECIVDEILVRDYGTTVVLSIDYIWRTNGTARPDDEPKLIVELYMKLVSDLIIHNELRAETLRDPSTLNWGAAEISRVLIELVKPFDASFHTAQESYRLTVRREEGPWIEVTFQDLIIGESSAPPPRSL